MRKLFILLLILGSFKPVVAQELDCKVQVLSNQIAGTDKRVFDAMQTAIYEFVNTRKWANETFKIGERIDCSILINITEKISADEFKATLQIQARRPVYKTSYNSALLNYNDNDVVIKYIENQPLEFVENTYTSNLTSIIAFYSYLVFRTRLRFVCIKWWDTLFTKSIGSSKQCTRFRISRLESFR